MKDHETVSLRWKTEFGFATITSTDVDRNKRQITTITKKGAKDEKV